MAKRSRLPPEEPEPPIPPERLAFAANFEVARLAADLRQVQFSKVPGIGQSHISKLEPGTWEPRLAVILALAKALGVQQGLCMKFLSPAGL